MERALELIWKCEHPGRASERGHSLAAASMRGEARGGWGTVKATSQPLPGLTARTKPAIPLPHAGSHHLINCLVVASDSQINHRLNMSVAHTAERLDWMLSLALPLEDLGNPDCLCGFFSSWVPVE